MHNDYPNVRVDTTEPLHNTYDWSQAPMEFGPFHPSHENYQIPGDGPGWNVRFDHFWTARYLDLMNYIFEEANNRTNQVACIWGHLPETDFLENIRIIDSLAHKAANLYPEVKFRYCTAIEAMQLWQNTEETSSAQITINEIKVDENVLFNIESDEPIFQPQLFVAAKDIYESYFMISCEQIGENQRWTTMPIESELLAKV